MTGIKARKFAHFWDSIKNQSCLLQVQKYQLLEYFVFYVEIYFLNLFGDLVQASFELYGRKQQLKNESVIFLSQNGKYEVL